jgi:hypothetical protein
MSAKMKKNERGECYSARSSAPHKHILGCDYLYTRSAKNEGNMTAIKHKGELAIPHTLAGFLP